MALAEKSGSHHGVVVQLVRIPACHAGGRGFEPRPLRQHKALQVFDLQGFFISYATFAPLAGMTSAVPTQDDLDPGHLALGNAHLTPCASMAVRCHEHLISSSRHGPFEAARFIGQDRKFGNRRPCGAERSRHDQRPLNRPPGLVDHPACEALRHLRPCRLDGSSMSARNCRCIGAASHAAEDETRDQQAPQAEESNHS